MTQTTYCKKKPNVKNKHFFNSQQEKYLYVSQRENTIQSYVFYIKFLRHWLHIYWNNIMQKKNNKSYVKYYKIFPISSKLYIYDKKKKLQYNPIKYEKN